MAKKKKKEEPKVVGRLGASGEIAPFDSARVLGRVDADGNKTAFIQAQKEQEIAPTKDTWFKKGALNDSGYAYTGTLDKINRFNASLFMSAVDILGNVGLGMTKPIEGIGDFAQNRFADVQELFGNKLGAEVTRKKAKEEWKVNKDLEQALASDNGMGIDDMSLLGTKGKGVAQGLGSVLLASASGGLGQIVGGTGAVANVASLGTMGVGAAGNAEQEALEQGATRKEARMYGLISGVGETLSEMMFGGLSKGSQVLGIGTGVFDSLDDAVASGLTKKIENKIVKNLIQSGVKATSEGVEEVISGMFDAVGKKLTYMSDEDIKKLIEDENLLDSFLSGTFSAALSQAPSYVQSVTTTEGGKVRLQNQNEIRDYITNLNEQEQRVVEQEIQDRINEEGKVSNKRRIQIEKQVIEDLDRGYISADKIEKTLGENYNQERDTRLAESFNERERKTQAYENDLSKYDEKQRTTIQKAIDSGLLNNSNKTHDFVDLIAKISADKGVDFDFTNNQRINETGFGIKGKTVNGYVKDGVINLNLESNQALNKTVGHEITHVLEGTEVYQELQNSLRSYLGEKEWNNRIKDLSETYKNVENANIENELTSDLVGDYIFNDESFVRNLSTRNQNLFQKIYDEIKYLVKVATAGSKQARELEKAKRMFEKAYRETQANKNTSSIETNAKIKKAAIETRNKESKTNIIKEEKTSEIAPKKQEKATNKKQANIPTKTDITNNENINKIKEKYDTANKITGSSKSVILNDGEKLSGTYKLIEAGEVTPSHNSENFTKSENFPTTEKGTTINDRDYENDKNAQQLVREKAQNYDGRAFNDNGVIVTKDGIVVSGNDRTMAGEIAARNNTDQAYIDYLKENASQYGFTVEQIESMDHPRVVLELNDDVDYDTQTFAKFNKESKKTKSITEKAKELGKTIDNDTIDRISNVISEYDKIDDVYNSAKASRELLDVLLNKGIIDNNEVSQVYDGNKFTGAGKDLIEATVLGSVISEDNLKFFRNNNDLKFKMMKAAPSIIENKSLGDYSIIDEINNAIEVYKNAQQAGMTVEELNNQTSLFGDSNFDLITKRIAETLEKRGFRNFLNFVSKYNLEATAPANGQVDIFTGEIPSKQDVLTNALNIDDNTDIVSYSLSEDAETFKTPYGVEVVKNPSTDDYIQMRQDILEEYPWLRGEKILRQTYDEEGNVYYWNAYDAQHADVEPYINKKYNTRTFQNDGWWKNPIYKDSPKDYSYVDTSNFKYSLSDTDSQGKELTQGQKDFFKDVSPEVKDENNQLMRFYHGSNSEFTIFDLAKGSQSNSNAGVGFWFTPNMEGARNFADSVWYGDKTPTTFEVYLNMKNPKVYETYDNTEIRNNLKEQLDNTYKERKALTDKYSWETPSLTNLVSYMNYMDDAKLVENLKTNFGFKEENAKQYVEDATKYIELNNQYKNIEKQFDDARWTDAYEQFRTDIYKIAGKSADDANTGGTGMALDNKEQVLKDYVNSLKEQGYDGIVIKNTVYDSDTMGGTNNQYVVFDPNQIKNITNENPTENDDIRYQLRNNEVAPTNGWEVRSEDVRLQSAFKDAIAPIQEQVQELNNSINELKENTPQYKAENIQDEENDFSDVSIENMTADDINYEPFMNYVENSSELAKERQGLRNELNQKKEVFIPKEKSSFRNTVDTLKALFTNKNVEIDNLARESGNLNIKYAGDMVNNTAAEAISNIENAQTNNEGKAIGRSLRSIFDEARNEGLEEAFNDYLLNWSNVDRHKQGKGSNISAEDSRKLIKQYEEKYPELKKMAKDLWQYSRNARHNLRDAGIISQDVSDMLGRMYPHYVPYISDGNDSYFVDMGELKPRQAIKRAKGGAIQETLLPVEEALTRYTYAQKKAVRQNDLYKEIVNTIGDNVMIGGDVRTDYTNMADSLYRDKNGNYLTAYVDGEQISTRISDNLYKSLSNELENNVKDIEQKLSFITKPLQKISQIRRDILTKWSPTFPVTNAMKDVQDALLNTKYTQDFIKNYPSAIAELRNNTELAAQFKSLYGSGTAMGQYDVDSGLYKANKGAKNNNFLKGIASINDLIELAPRYAEFKASLDNGASIQEAMYNAREVTTNFSRGGVITKALNRNGFTFLNASVQGLSKFIRNFSGENGARGITNSLIKATIFGVAPAVFNELAFGSGDDKDEEYEALPDYIKDNYYLIKLSNGTFIRLPKGRMLSVFGSAARRTLEAMQGEEDAFEGFLQNVNSQIGVNNPEENNIFSPLIQAYGTKNGTAWYGGDIVPSRLQNVPKGEQYDASTDRLSIFLGEKLGISPYKLNYVLDQYTGGLGDIFLPMMTQEASSDGSLLAPIKDKFTADSTSDNKYVSDFYTKNDELKINANSSKATDEDKLKQKYMSSISSEMAELYKERREIQSSDLPKSTKYKKAQSIKDEINRLAKEGLDNYNNVVIEGNYAQIGDNEYYKNGDTWTKVKDDTNGLGLNLQEKAEYYNVKSNISQTKKNNDGNDKPLVIEDIVNSNLTPEAKANLYTSNYKDDLINPMVDLGVDVDSYLTYKAQNFAADKDANGNSINGSKKRKVFDYINSMNIPYEQKLILAKSEYNSFNDNNVEILEYINNSNMSYDEKMTLITKLGFKVDGNNVSW